MNLKKHLRHLVVAATTGAVALSAGSAGIGGVGEHHRRGGAGSRLCHPSE